MSSRIVSHFLADILASINAIARFTEQMNFEQFQHDKKTIRAVEREFEIIGEAVKTQQPGDSSPSRTPNAPPAILPPAPPPRGASPDTKIPVSANTAK